MNKQTPCTRRELLDHEKEAIGIINQRPIPLIMKLLHTDVRAQTYLKNNAILIQAAKERIGQVEKKYYQCDLEGTIKMEIKKENGQYQMVPMMIEGVDTKNFGKDMQEAYETMTSEIIE